MQVIAIQEYSQTGSRPVKGVCLGEDKNFFFEQQQHVCMINKIAKNLRRRGPLENCDVTWQDYWLVVETKPGHEPQEACFLLRRWWIDTSSSM